MPRRKQRVVYQSLVFYYRLSILEIRFGICLDREVDQPILLDQRDRCLHDENQRRRILLVEILQEDESLNHGLVLMIQPYEPNISSSEESRSFKVST